MSSKQWNELVEASEASTLTLTLAQRNTIAETAAYLSAIEEQNDRLRAKVTRLEMACQNIVALASGWDKDGALGPRAPLSWETVARMAMDYARSALARDAARGEQDNASERTAFLPGK